MVWNYSGWDSLGCFAGEVRNAQRSYPIGIMICLVFITINYALPIFSGLAYFPDTSRWSSEDCDGSTLSNFTVPNSTAPSSAPPSFASSFASYVPSSLHVSLHSSGMNVTSGSGGTGGAGGSGGSGGIGGTTFVASSASAPGNSSTNADTVNLVSIGQAIAPWLGATITFGAILSALGQLNVVMASSSRALWCMAQPDCQMLPSVIGWSWKRYSTPVVSIFLQGAIIGFLVSYDFDILVQFDTFLNCISLVLEFVAFVWLKYSAPNALRPYAVPGGMAGAIAITVPKAIIIVYTLWAQNWITWVVCGVLNVAIVAGFFCRHLCCPRAALASWRGAQGGQNVAWDDDLMANDYGDVSDPFLKYGTGLSSYAGGAAATTSAASSPSTPPSASPSTSPSNTPGSADMGGVEYTGGAEERGGSSGDGGGGEEGGGGGGGGGGGDGGGGGGGGVGNGGSAVPHRRGKFRSLPCTTLLRLWCCPPRVARLTRGHPRGGHGNNRSSSLNSGGQHTSRVVSGSLGILPGDTMERGVTAMEGSMGSLVGSLVGSPAGSLRVGGTYGGGDDGGSGDGRGGGVGGSGGGVGGGSGSGSGGFGYSSGSATSGAAASSSLLSSSSLPPHSLSVQPEHQRVRSRSELVDITVKPH
jgi:uncharacterized membrane protein YgcG